MEPTAKILQGNSEEEIWSQLREDFKGNDPFVDDYEVVIQQEGTTISLSIEIDLGGGFESGYESTTLLSQVQLKQPFRFLLQHEGFLVEVGKLFGLEDVEVGDVDFDEKVRVKTSDVTRFKRVFQRLELREFVESLEAYEFSLEPGEDNPLLHTLKLQIDEAIVEPSQLQNIYSGFRLLVKEIGTE